MGTRADFYVGRGEKAEWIGSIAWDGYPSGFGDEDRADPKKCKAEDAYRQAVAAELSARDDSTLPGDGWPWPWEDSATTDYAYAFDDGQVWGSCFGGEWFKVNEPEPEDSEDGPRKKTAVFPNMKEHKKVTFGKRSGLLIIGGPPME